MLCINKRLYRAYRPSGTYWSAGCDRTRWRSYRSDGFHGRYRPDRSNWPAGDHRSDGTHR